MVLFPSDEWAKEFMKKLNENKAYEDSALDWEGDFYLVIQPDDRLKEEKIIYLDLYHGKCREAYLVEPGKEKEPAYVMEAPYGTWIKVSTREVDAIKGIMTGKIKLKGDMAKIMRYTKAAQEIVNTTTVIDNEFL